ncbi:PKD domain-containing protein [Nocardioides pocheonensis]|uniref:PKD domain-containing protein n=1 Tax=Nocardioides pocheonensis TaxID=661485 RepID=A0A3N0GYX1_9ACTN|nr:PKD domain-containing protein [Nocardioides pocheonensis]
MAVSWNPDDVRQGRHLDPSDDYNRSASGTMSVTYSVSGTGSLDASSEGLGTLSIGFGPVSLTASGTCDLKTSGAAYTCHLESSSVDLFDLGSAALGTPYVHGKMVADVTVTPDQLATLRTASAGGQTLGTNALNLPEGAVVDPLLVGCKTGTGDSLSYALGDFSASPGLHVVSSVELSAGVIIPNPITAIPGIYVELASDTFPVATTNTSVTMAGPGGSVDMGAIKPNNIAPTLGAVSAPDGVEGSPIQFSTSATGPCAAGGTYTWDFGDGGNGHTATPQHTYADNGVYTGQVVFTDSTGLTDTEDFTVHVSNAAPNVTVVPGAPVTVAWGKPLTLKAQAVDPGAADQSTLTYDWDFADGDSIDNGGPSESHSWTTPGDRAPTVNVCDKDGACTLKTFTVHVRTHATTLAYTGPQAAAYSSTSTLTASLQDEFGTPINNAPVAFSVDGTVVGTALTNGSGHASLDYVVTRTAGSHTVSAAYAGSSLYDADTSATTPFTVSAMASTITYTGGLTGAPNKATAVSAKVLDALGRPLAGYPVTIVIGSQSMTATTNSSGVASGQIVLNQKPGYYPLTASWAGDAGKYLGASTSAQFSLNKK